MERNYEALTICLDPFRYTDGIGVPLFRSVPINVQRQQIYYQHLAPTWISSHPAEEDHGFRAVQAVSWIPVGESAADLLEGSL